MEATDARATAIVVAAGAGTRLGADEPKAFLDVGGRPILVRAAEAAAASGVVERVLVAVPEGFERRARELLSTVAVPVDVVVGGATRQASVRAALAAVPASSEIVVVHDAARCFASPELFGRVVAAVAAGAVGAIPVLAVTDTVKRIDDGRAVSTLDRAGLGLAQTPQAFRRRELVDAHERAASAGVEATDDAALLEEGGDVRVVQGDPANVKITTPEDLAGVLTREEVDG
jgi:2-C-methyl-D-erythritol 4-phosphate cytidylyltransferase